VRTSIFERAKGEELRAKGRGAKGKGRRAKGKQVITRDKARRKLTTTIRKEEKYDYHIDIDSTGGA